MIIRGPWLSALFLALAGAGSLLEWLLRDGLWPPGRAFLTPIVATCWGLFGAAAFEYIKARYDLRASVDTALAALSDRSEEGLLVAVKALERQKVNGFFDNPATVTFVRILVLLRDSCTLIRMRRWAEAQRLLGSNPLALDRDIKSLQPVPQATRELLCHVLTTNLETSTIYAGLASAFPRWDAWIEERVERSAFPEWDVAVTALDDLAEATARFLEDPWPASAAERARAFGAEATLLSIAMNMAFYAKWDRPATDLPTPHSLVDEHIHRKLGVPRQRLWRVLANSLATWKDARYPKCLLMSNIHSASYIDDVVEHPHGPEKLYRCEEELMTAAETFPVELRIVRYNICVCLWRSGKTHLAHFDRCMGLLLAERALAADQRVLFSALRDFVSGDPAGGIQSLFSLISNFKRGLGKIVKDELDKFARASGDGSGVDLNLAEFEAAGRRPAEWTGASGVLLGIFIPAYGDAPRRYPLFHPTLFGEAEV